RCSSQRGDLPPCEGPAAVARRRRRVDLGADPTEPFQVDVDLLARVHEQLGAVDQAHEVVHARVTPALELAERADVRLLELLGPTAGPGSPGMRESARTGHGTFLIALYAT